MKIISNRNIDRGVAVLDDNGNRIDDNVYSIDIKIRPDSIVVADIEIATDIEMDISSVCISYKIDSMNISELKKLEQKIKKRINIIKGSRWVI